MSEIEYREQISAYLDGTLASEDKASLEQALAQDPKLAQEMQEFKTLLSAMSAMPPLHAPSGFSERVIKGIRRRRWLDEQHWQSTLTLVLQILSVLVVIGIATAYMIAQTEFDERRVLEIEEDKTPPEKTPENPPE